MYSLNSKFKIVKLQMIKVDLRKKAKQERMPSNNRNHKRQSKKSPLSGALDAWAEKALKQRGKGCLEGKEEKGLAPKWLGSLGQKLEHMTMAVDDSK